MRGAARAQESGVGWDADSAVAWQRFPRLNKSAVADACVIGLGGSGLAAIGELLGRGLDVIGIDAGRIAGRAAGRNGGFLLAGPALAIHDAARQWGEDVAVDLYRETLAEIDHLEMLLGSEVIRRTGSLRVAGLPGEGDGPRAVDAAGELADCEEQYAFMTERGLPVQRYSGPLGAGLYFPRDAAMNPVRRAMGLAALYGGRARLFERTPAIALESGAVVTQYGTISADTIIVAVDGGLETIVPSLGPRVASVRLQMACTVPAPLGLLPCPVYANNGFDYLQQDDMGRIFAGGGRDQFEASEWTVSTSPTDEVQRWIGSLIDRVAPGFGSRVTHRWAASVGFTPDGKPLVTTVLPGVVACGGYGGTGNLIGPIAARAAVSLAIDGVAPPPCFAR